MLQFLDESQKRVGGGVSSWPITALCHLRQQGHGRDSSHTCTHTDTAQAHLHTHSHSPGTLLSPEHMALPSAVGLRHKPANTEMPSSSTHETRAQGQTQHITRHSEASSGPEEHEKNLLHRQHHLCITSAEWKGKILKA